MSGAIQQWPQRIVAGGYMELSAGPVANLFATLGGVASSTFVSTGVVDITLKVAVRLAPAPQAIAFANVVGTAHYASVAWQSATVLRVSTFDAAGAAANANFNFLILTTERIGGA